jgi:CRP-like cAMP-binding protein
MATRSIHDEIKTDWEKYLQYGKRLFFRRKSVIYQQGATGSGFYYLDKGMVKIVTVTAHHSQRILDIVGNGRVFGEQVMDQRPFFSSAVAIEDSIVYHFDCKRFKELLATAPELLQLFINSTINKISILATEINLKTLSSEQKIAYSLQKIIHSAKNNIVPVSQQDLAQFTGLTRITVYKILKKWQEENIIEIKKRTLIVKQPCKLEKMAGLI